MRRSRFALDTRIAALGLAFVVAVVSMPIAIGWVVSADSRCCVSTDICHPAQMADVRHASLFASAPPLKTMVEFSRDTNLGTHDGYRAMAGRLGEAPESPPPKSLA